MESRKGLGGIDEMGIIYCDWCGGEIDKIIGGSENIYNLTFCNCECMEEYILADMKNGIFWAFWTSTI